MKPYQIKRIEAGLCLRCGKIPPVTKVLCQGCLDINKERVVRLKSLNLCTQCGKVPAHPEGFRCTHCIGKEKSSRTIQNRAYYEQARQLGKCRRCGEPAVQGKTRCKKCAEEGNAFTLKRLRGRYDFINAYKLERGCIECGYKEHAAALEFDHLPGSDKVDNVSSLVAKASWDKVLAEIDKCEIVCANHHAIRTWNRLRGNT